ncbi:syndetin isoform X2 [Belonocnema kinseyi]|nr:syndetin isoform X2 [Belonocnema kinseyi]
MGLHPDLLNPLSSSESHNHEDRYSEAGQSTESEAVPDQEILESIEQIYYEADSDFDPCRYELEKLPKELNSKDIERYYKKLKQQHQVVSKKVLQLILQKQSDCKEEFERILLVQEQLQDTLAICRVGRADLNLARKQFTTASLGILAHYRKRQIIEDLLSSLNTIKTLQRTEDRLQELLNEENYPGAISLLLECQNAAQTFKHFHCVAALNGKLQDTLEQVEETLDVTLAKMCTQFDVTTYSSVQEAYNLLGKSQTAMDQLHMHFTAAIHNTAFTAVHSFAGGDMKRQYKQLCLSTSQENFIPCLTELCKSMWAILSSYYLIVKWHGSRENQAKQDTLENKDLEADFNQQYVKQKLENGVIRIWHDVETKISTFMGTDLSNFKFEQFVQVLGIINRLMKVGEELCASKSENLQECIRKQCLSYFSNYHISRLDELRIFLENDGWELCPVKPTFVATQLQEFKSLKPILNSFKNWNASESSSLSENENCVTNGWLQRCLDGGTSPFDVGLDETMDEDILANTGDDISGYFSDDSDEDIPEELRHDYVDESDHAKVIKKKHKIKHSGPIVTNTTLSVLRVCGKYLQMIRLLKSIAVTVIQSMIQFFELYFYTVHLFFTSDLVITSDSLYSPKLKLALARMKENLIINESDMENPSNRTHKIQQPLISPIVNLTQPDKLHGLTERAVAVESLIFLGQQYESFKHYFEHLIANSPERNYLHQFYVQTITSVTDLRKPVYMAVVSQALDIAGVLILMTKVNWEVRDVMSQHSSYVDKILQEMQVLRLRLNDTGNRVPLPKEVDSAIWENVAHLVTRTLVEGFSNAKKCSNGGRGLMQLDFTQLTSKFESFTSLRPMPHKEYVELYIKAFYLTEDKLEEWVKEHKEYSTKQLVGLVSCTCQNNKKTRQRLIAVVEDQRPNR